MADEGLAASLAATAADGPPGRPNVDWSKYNQPFGSVSAGPAPSPSERVTQGVVNLFNAAGADNYTANNLGSKLMGLVQATPLGAPLAAADAAHYKSQGDIGGTAMAMAGAIPGVKPAATAARAVAEEAAPAAKSIAGQLGKIAIPTLGPTSDVNPGVYSAKPDEISGRGCVSPMLCVYQRPALKQLFGVTRQDLYDISQQLFGVNRQDLYDISQQGRRQGNVDPQLWAPGKASKVNEASAAVMNPANAQRIVDTLGEASKYPELVKGMVPWYVMDPAYQRMEQLVGPERAAKEYHDFNMTVSPFSAGSAVPVELNRGTAANMMRVRGDYPAFQQYGGMPPGKRPDDIRDLLAGAQGHLMHKGPAAAVARYIDTGEHGFDPNTVKIPLYAQASGVPQTGFQTRLPVPDTHFASAIGMPEARTSADFRGFMDGPEYRHVGPWFRENVAKPMNMEAVPAQAFTWGTYGPQTGVRTNVGAGKLELLAQNIWERAKKLGIDPARLRDDVLTGKGHASILATGGLGGLLGGMAMQQGQEQRQ